MTAWRDAQRGIKMNLEKHIMDTIKEWQIKIGYREGDMKLYYPGKSLAVLLGLPAEADEDRLVKALEEFSQAMEPKLGKIIISGNYERYCLDIPDKGCAYVADQVPEPVFLKRFLKELMTPGNTMEQIRACFAAYAEEHGITYVEEPAGEEEDARAFCFTDNAADEYVYFVEENEFGLTYHRFARTDYEI